MLHIYKYIGLSLFQTVLVYIYISLYIYILIHIIPSRRYTKNRGLLLNSSWQLFTWQLRHQTSQLSSTPSRWPCKRGRGAVYLVILCVSRIIYLSSLFPPNLCLPPCPSCPSPSVYKQTKNKQIHVICTMIFKQTMITIMKHCFFTEDTR